MFIEVECRNGAGSKFRTYLMSKVEESMELKFEILIHLSNSIKNRIRLAFVVRLNVNISNLVLPGHGTC